MKLRYRREQKLFDPTDRRRPAFFLQALLSEDIPPYLTDQAGEKLPLPDDKLARVYQKRLQTDPASL